MREKICANCAFWLFEGMESEVQGECRRYPAAPAIITREDFWCGEFKKGK